MHPVTLNLNLIGRCLSVLSFSVFAAVATGLHQMGSADKNNTLSPMSALMTERVDHVVTSLMTSAAAAAAPNRNNGWTLEHTFGSSDLAERSVLSYTTIRNPATDVQENTHHPRIIKTTTTTTFSTQRKERLLRRGQKTRREFMSDLSDGVTFNGGVFPGSDEIVESTTEFRARGGRRRRLTTREFVDTTISATRWAENRTLHDASATGTGKPQRIKIRIRNRMRTGRPPTIVTGEKLDSSAGSSDFTSASFVTLSHSSYTTSVNLTSLREISFTAVSTAINLTSVDSSNTSSSADKSNGTDDSVKLAPTVGTLSLVSKQEIENKSNEYDDDDDGVESRKRNGEEGEEEEEEGIQWNYMTERAEEYTTAPFSNSSSKLLLFSSQNPSNSANLSSMPLPALAATGIVLGLICIVTATGNVLVLLAVGCNSHLRGTTQYFIANLAVADLLLGTTVLPFSASLEVIDYWAFGPTMCDIWAAMDVLCCTASILSLCVISVDRYIGVTRPLRHSSILTVRRCCYVIVGIWLLSVAISIAPLFGWKEPASNDPLVCEVTKQLGYVLFSVAGSFYIPLTVILVVYYRVYREATHQSHFLATGMKTSRSTGAAGEEGSGEITLRVHTGGLKPPDAKYNNHNDRTSLSVARDRRRSSVAANSETETGVGESGGTVGGKNHFSRMLLAGKIAKFNREKKAAKTLGIVVGVFVLCWFPFFFILPLEALCTSCHVPQWLFKTMFWLGYCNSMMNPVIYAFASREFKLAFLRILRCRCTRRDRHTVYQEALYARHKAEMDKKAKEKSSKSSTVKSTLARVLTRRRPDNNSNQSNRSVDNRQFLDLQDVEFSNRFDHSHVERSTASDESKYRFYQLGNSDQSATFSQNYDQSTTFSQNYDSHCDIGDVLRINLSRSSLTIPVAVSIYDETYLEPSQRYPFRISEGKELVRDDLYSPSKRENSFFRDSAKTNRGDSFNKGQGTGLRDKGAGFRGGGAGFREVWRTYSLRDVTAVFRDRQGMRTARNQESGNGDYRKSTFSLGDEFVKIALCNNYL